MTRHLIIACAIYLALVLQPSLPADGALTTFRPWLPAIALVVCVQMARETASLAWAGVLGLGVDSLSGDRLGIHVVVATLVATGMIAMKSDRRSRSVLQIGILTFGGTFLWLSLVTTIHQLLDHRTLALAETLVFSAKNGLSTAGLSLAALLLVRLILNAFRQQRTASVTLGNRWSMLN